MSHPTQLTLTVQFVEAVGKKRIPLFGRTRDVTLQALDCLVDRRIRGCGWGGQGVLRLLGGLDGRDILF